MPTTLTYGPVHTILQNVVYALPPRRSLLFSNTALQVSNDVAFATSASIAASTTVESAAGFVRCTTGNALVRVVA